MGALTDSALIQRTHFQPADKCWQAPAVGEKANIGLSQTTIRCFAAGDDLPVMTVAGLYPVSATDTAIEVGSKN